MWEYLTLFVLAATPLVELLVVIPLGIGYGLHPVPVALVTVAGNALPVLGIVLAFDAWRGWRRGRAPAAAGMSGDAPDVADPAAGADPPAAGRRVRAQRLWARYGTPGLALLAPLVTGVHLAAVVALALGAPRRAVAGWMLASITVWTAGVTLVIFLGIESVRHYFG